MKTHTDYYQAGYLARLNQARAASGLRVREIAQKAGVSRQSVSNVLTGQTKATWAVRKVAEALGLVWKQDILKPVDP